MRDALERKYLARSRTRYRSTQIASASASGRFLLVSPFTAEHVIGGNNRANATSRLYRVTLHPGSLREKPFTHETLNKAHMHRTPNNI